MKKITLLLITVLGTTTLFGQQKSTGTQNLGGGVSVNYTLDNATSTVNLIISGPNSTWFAVAFGSITSGMASGNDIVWWDGTTLIDGRQNGQPNAPSNDTQNWTISSTLSGSTRIINATRSFSTGDTGNDFVFNYSQTNIKCVYAIGNTGNTTISSGHSSHGGVTTLSYTTLGTEDFSLNASSVYPNPSNGQFFVKTKTNLEKINIYTHTGAFVKTIEVENTSDAVEVNVNGLQTGIYLVELINENEKSWKKIMVQ
jgi:hypothetical protein